MTEKEYRETFRLQYSDLLYRATRYVGEGDADDVVQEAFVELWRARGSIADGGHTLAFLRRAVYHRALNVLAHRHITSAYTADEKRLALARMEYYATSEDTAGQTEAAELRLRIEQAIDRLPEKCREVFRMSYLHDMKARDIAAIMQISPRTVDAHIYKALRQLRVELGTVWGERLLAVFLIFYTM